MTKSVDGPRLDILAILADFPAIEDVVAGDRVRSLEILSALAGPRCDVHVVTLASGVRTARPGEHLGVTPLPLAHRRLTDLAPLARIARVLRQHAGRAQAAGYRPILYVKIPGGIYLRGGVIPVHSNPAHLLTALARRMGYLIWSTVHDLPPEHDMAVLARRRRSGEPAAAVPARALRWAAHLGGTEARQVFRRSDLVTVVSEGMRQAVLERCSVPGERIVVATTGVNPALVEAIPAWTVPAPDAPITVAYVGSPYDVEMGTLVRTAGQIAKRSGRHLVLLLSSEPGPLIPIPAEVTVKVRASRYASFPEFARSVDVWLNPYAADDRYIMEMGSPIKLPMYVASGRPTVATAGPYLDRDGLSEWTFPAAPSIRGFTDATVAVLEDLPAAQERAALGRTHMLDERTWAMTARRLARRLEALVDGSSFIESGEAIA